jgi:dTDP-4-amino-4,6-dideoxygalactose transaminase
MIPQWNKKFNDKEILKNFNINLKKKYISQSKITQSLENKISKFLNVKYVLAVPSGTVALLISLMSLGLKKNDEIIISDRAWVSVINVVNILGLKAKFVDVEVDRPIINLDNLKKTITKHTKAIIPIHMGGRFCDMNKLIKFAKSKKIFVIEDAAQAFGCRYKKRFIGTQSDIGCFSMSIAKTISSGQGGFVVTNKKNLYEKLLKIKNNGLKNIKTIQRWGPLGLNFKFSDILASIALTELKKFNYYKKKLINLYKFYEEGLKNSKNVKLIPVNIKNGEIPQYIEIISHNRKKLHKHLLKKNIDIRLFYPSMSEHNNLKSNFKNSLVFSKKGIYLPSGPDQNKKDIIKVIKEINLFK